jgi:hypothetical protein
VLVGRGARRSEEKDEKKANTRQLRKDLARPNHTTLESNPSAKASGCGRKILEGRQTTTVVDRSVLERAY